MKKIILFLFILTNCFCISAADDTETLLLTNVKANPSNYIYHKALGIYYYQNENYDKSIEYLSNALQLQDVDKELYEYLFKSYLNQKKIPDAEYIIQQGIKYFPELQKHIDNGIKYKFTLWVNYQYYSERYKSKISDIIKQELSNEKLFQYEKFYTNYETKESVIKFNASLKNFYFYKEFEIAEIIGNSIITDLIILYKIKELNYDLLDALKKFLIEKTRVTNAYYEYYYGYKKLLKLKETDSDNGYKEYFSPITFEIDAPFLNQFLTEHLCDNVIKKVECKQMNFNDSIKELRTVYDKIPQPEFKLKIENFIYDYIISSFKNLTDYYKKIYSEFFQNTFPEQKFSLFFKTVQSDDKENLNIPVIESKSTFITNESNFSFLSLKEFDIENPYTTSFIKKNFLVKTVIDKLPVYYDFQKEEYSIEPITFKKDNKILRLKSDVFPLKFYRSNSRYYKEKNEISDWNLYFVFNIKKISTLDNKIFDITMDIFYAKLYNKKFQTVLYEWFDIDNFKKENYNLNKQELDTFLSNIQ